MPLKINLNGKQFGRLQVIESISKKDKANRSIVYWKCKCSCGNFIEVRSSNLIRGTKSCGCLQKEIIGNLNKKDDGLSSLNSLYLIYKSKAKSKNRQFTLTKEEFKILTSQNCYYCNKQPNQKSLHYKNGTYYIYNGIDRINSNIGYIKENCVTCCGICNTAKNDLTQEEFFNIIKLIYERHLK